MLHVILHCSSPVASQVLLTIGQQDECSRGGDRGGEGIKREREAIAIISNFSLPVI